MTSRTFLHDLADSIGLIVIAVVLAALLALGIGIGPGHWQTVGSPDGVVTPADTIHPNIHQNNGPGQNANPNGANDGGGNMHGIANVPGQSGADPADGAPGFADQLETVHGGIGAYNPIAAG